MTNFRSKNLILIGLLALSACRDNDELEYIEGPRTRAERKTLKSVSATVLKQRAEERAEQAKRDLCGEFEKRFRKMENEMGDVFQVDEQFHLDAQPSAKRALKLEIREFSLEALKRYAVDLEKRGILIDRLSKGIGISPRLDVQIFGGQLAAHQVAAVKQRDSRLLPEILKHKEDAPVLLLTDHFILKRGQYLKTLGRDLYVIADLFEMEEGSEIDTQPGMPDIKSGNSNAYDGGSVIVFALKAKIDNGARFNTLGGPAGFHFTPVKPLSKSQILAELSDELAQSSGIQNISFATPPKNLQKGFAKVAAKTWAGVDSMMSKQVGRNLTNAFRNGSVGPDYKYWMTVFTSPTAIYPAPTEENDKLIVASNLLSVQFLAKITAPTASVLRNGLKIKVAPVVAQSPLPDGNSGKIYIESYCDINARDDLFTPLSDEARLYSVNAWPTLIPNESREIKAQRIYEGKVIFRALSDRGIEGDIDWQPMGAETLGHYRLKLDIDKSLEPREVSANSASQATPSSPSMSLSDNVSLDQMRERAKKWPFDLEGKEKEFGAWIDTPSRKAK